MTLQDKLCQLKEFFKNKEYVQSAMAYGSSAFSEGDCEDVDIALMVPSDQGVVDYKIYLKLSQDRRNLCSILGVNDVDLVVHTSDETERPLSPLTFPRYNPSLSFARSYGNCVKAEFPVPRINLAETYSPSDLAEYVMSDTRTITRRQAIRPSNAEHIRIFLSKIAHGPGNYITLLYLRDGCWDYIADPSDTAQCFDTFRRMTDIDIEPALDRIQQLKRDVKIGAAGPRQAFPLITWYEHLFRGAISSDFASLKMYMKETF